MDVYASEEEQVEAIKKWWKENGTAVILGVIIGAGALFGWRYWETKVTAEGEAASSVYMQMGSLLAENKTEEATTLADSLLEKHSETPYASFASLTLAKKAVDDGKIDVAKTHLKWVIDNSELDEIKQVAKMRLARLHLATDDNVSAWQIIEPLAKDSKLGSVHELKGDILFAQEKTDEARNAYLQAFALSSESLGAMDGANQGSSFLEMKLQDLGSTSE